MIKLRQQKHARVCQGDLFSDIEHVEWIKRQGSEVLISTVVYPLVIVLTQDCDLSRDYEVRWSRKDIKTMDKQLLSVLVAPAYNADQVIIGDHLSELGRKMQDIGKKNFEKTISKQQNARYHFLDFGPGSGIAPCIVDFKHYFSVDVAYLKSIKSQKFRGKVAELYRERIAQRFTNFLSRIGLPDEL